MTRIGGKVCAKLNMEPVAFVAASAEEAVAQIRARLGPEAVVVNVRPLPAQGLARLWQKPMIEVLAYRPEAPSPPPVAPATLPLADALEEFRQRLTQIEQHVKTPAPKPPPAPAVLPESADAVINLNAGGWHVGEVLQKTGLLPVHAQWVLDRIRAQYGDEPPNSLGEEITLARGVLTAAWRPASAFQEHSLHVIVGPAGSGKTTCLCKWLTLSALVEGRLARVWRLDGTTANMAEALTIYCEILHLPSERAWAGSANPLAEDIGFIDLPGVDWRRPETIQDLANELRAYGLAHLHLALNGAYDVGVMLAQARAFAALPIEDLMITHLDEEVRWGKMWNLVLGANLPIRYLSTGQNIPGDFCPATAEAILGRQFPQGRQIHG